MRNMPEDRTSVAMRSMREESAVVQVDIEPGHRLFIEAETADDGYGLVEHYVVRHRGSHVDDATVERDGLWVRRELSRNEFSWNYREETLTR